MLGSCTMSVLFKCKTSNEVSVWSVSGSSRSPTVNTQPTILRCSSAGNSKTLKGKSSQSFDPMYLGGQ